MSTPTYEEVAARLTAPGAPFELTTERVQGQPVSCFARRERSMREKIENAGRRGDQTCMVYGERRIPYGDFARGVWGAARELSREHGLVPGDRLAVLSYNCPDWIIALFGAVSAGAVGVGLNGWWATEELAYGLEDSGSRFLVVDERLYPRVEPLLGRLPALERVFYIGAAAPPGTVPIDELLVPCEQPPVQPIAEDDPFVLLYTSGTTGRSKGCITTHTARSRRCRGSCSRTRSVRCSPARRRARARAGAGRPRRCSPRRCSTSAGSTRASAHSSASARRSCSWRAASTPSRRCA
jgi:long-chain acyl-CoA synthetase